MALGGDGVKVSQLLSFDYEVIAPIRACIQVAVNCSEGGVAVRVNWGEVEGEGVALKGGMQLDLENCVEVHQLKPYYNDYALVLITITMVGDPFIIIKSSSLQQGEVSFLNEDDVALLFKMLYIAQHTISSFCRLGRDWVPGQASSVIR